MSFVVTVSILAVVTAITCAIPGVIVVANKDAMLLDGMGHAVLPGIVVGALISGSVQSPLLVLFAGAAAFLVALGTRWLAETGLIAEGGALGLVFPSMFAVGIVLLSLNFSNVHFDVHTVLVGNLNLAALSQPSYLWTLVPIMLANIVFVGWLLPLLGACAFDERAATVAGVPVRALRLTTLALTSLTVTASFYAAGVMLVIAMMVLPAATGRIFAVTVRIPGMSMLSQILCSAVVIALIGSVVGFWSAYRIDIPAAVAITLAYALLLMAALGEMSLRRRGRKRVPAFA